MTTDEDNLREARIVAAELPAALAAELKSKGYAVRARACLELTPRVEVGDVAAIELMTTFLSDDHPEVRSAAAEVLASGPAELVVEHLLKAHEELTDHVRPGVRASFMFALGLLDVPCHGAVCEALLRGLDSRESDVRFQAAVGLNRIGCSHDAFANAALGLLDDADDEVAAVAATALADWVGGGDVDAPRERILDRWRGAVGGFAQRHLALAAAHLGSDEVVSTLERAIRTGMDGLPAVEALVALGSSEARRTLARMARSWRVHPILRARAAVGLAELGEADGDALVRKNLHHRRTDVRGATIDCLGESRLDRFADDLVAILGDRRRSDSAQAAEALGRLDSPSARPALEVAAEQDPRTEVRSQAVAALASLEDP